MPDAPHHTPRPEHSADRSELAGLRVALAHDWVCGLRGGELVLDAIVRTLAAEGAACSALYTMFHDGRPLTPAIDALPVRVSSVGRLPMASSRLRRWCMPLYPSAVRALSRTLARDHNRSPFDLLISTSSAAIKSLRAPAGVAHLCYCHAPARWAWSLREGYADRSGLTGTLRAAGLALARTPFCSWDARTAGRVDAFLANSAHTAERVRSCYGREAEVLFPPVRTDLFTPDPRVHREAFWLLAGAIEPYKRADLSVRAAHAAGVELRIVGTGSAAASVKALAESLPGARVSMLGRVSEAALLDLFRRARLLVFPQIEDFGITAVEAQAAGCPVVARAAGGALDTVIDGETGSLFDEPTPEALRRAAERCPAGGRACVDNAARFGEAAFSAGLLRAVSRLV